MENHKNFKWLVKQLYKQRTQKEIAAMCNVHVGTIEKYVKVFKLKGIKQRNVSTKPFRLSDPTFAYLFGLFITDGYLNPNTVILEITLHSKDKEILHYISTYYGCKCKYYGDTARLYFSRARTLEFCKLLDFKLGAKTFTAYVPDVFPKLLHKYIVRGMIDGDGTIRPNGEIRLYSESEKLLKFAEEYFTSKGVLCSRQENKKVLSTFKGIKAGLLLYKNLPDLCIKRKKIRIQNLVDDIVRAYQMINDMKWLN